MREVALEVHLVFFAVGGMVQETVVVVEDVPFGDGVITVVGSEFSQCPTGDVLLSVRVVFVVSVEREALGIPSEVEIWNHVNHQRLKRFVTSNTTNANYPIFRSTCGKYGGKVGNLIIHNSIEKQMGFCERTVK